MACCTAAPTGGLVPLSDFVPYVRPWMLSAPQDLMEHAIRLAAIEFCRDVKVVKRTVYVDSVANVSDYQIDIEDDYRPVAVNRVSDTQAELPVMTSMPVMPYQWAPRGHIFKPPKDLYLFPTPGHDCERFYEVELYVQPGQDTCQLDRILYDSFAEVIGWGAMARMYNMRDGGWYDARQAVSYDKKFSAGKANAKTLASRNFSTAPLIATAKRWV